MLLSPKCGGRTTTTLHLPLCSDSGPSHVISHAVLPLVFTFPSSFDVRFVQFVNHTVQVELGTPSGQPAKQILPMHGIH